MRLKIWVAVAAVAIGATTAAEQKTPAEWKWRIDGPGSVTDAPDPTGANMTFVAMPPGWHITTGPGGVLYHPAYLGKGQFSVEAEIFLFPGDSQEEYGVFLGGKNLGPAETPSYLAFVARRDGRGAILRRFGPPVVDWKANDAILPHPGKGTAKNVLRVDATENEIIFLANGKELARVPRASVNLDGQFGFRVGKGINLHASRLDVAYRLAPPPVK